MVFWKKSAKVHTETCGNTLEISPRETSQPFKTSSAESSSIWPVARIISEEDVNDPNLEYPGWYIYRNQAGRVYSLRPNPETKDFDKMEWPFLYEKDEIAQWLGTQAPEEFFIYNKLPEAITNLSPALNTNESERKDSFKSSQNTPKRKRNRSLHLRFTPAEFAKFERLATESGLSKNAFALQRILKSKTIANTGSPDAIMALYQETKSIRDELDRQGRMLKKIIKPNKGQRDLLPEEWDALIQSYSSINTTTDSLREEIEKINGYFET